MLGIVWLLADAPSTLIDYVIRGGTPALLIILIYGGFKTEPWWVFGWTYRDLLARHDRLRKETNNWRDIALRGTNIAEALTKIDIPSKVEAQGVRDEEDAI